MNITILASSSKANAAVLFTGKNHYLIDCGLSAGKIAEELRKINLQPADISGVLVTHEHGDHTAGLLGWLRTTKAQVFCNELTARVLGVTAKLFTNGCGFVLDDIEVTPFTVMHDAIDPVGFRFDNNTKRVGWLTDTGRCETYEIENTLESCNELFIESNYDVNMLEGSDRPLFLKQRTKAPHGHLSNFQTAEFIKHLRKITLGSATLLHLSRHCNTPEIAKKTVFLRTGLQAQVA